MTTQLTSSTTLDPTTFISLHHGQPMTNSLKVAEAFGKQHKDVLRKIELLECSSDFRQRNFAQASYEVEQPNGGKATYKTWEMTKDGFIFVVMGFTGKKAAAIKEAYINAFNWMTEQLFGTKHQQVSFNDDELHSLTWLWRAADNMMDAARTFTPCYGSPNTKRQPATTPSSTNTPLP